MTVFSRSEMLGRIKRLKEKMEEKEIDCVTVFGFANSYYLHGVPTWNFSRLKVPLIPLDGDPAVIVPAIGEADAKEHSWIKDIRVNRPGSIVAKSSAKVVEMIREFLEGRERAKIGVDFENIFFSTYMEYKRELPNVELVDVSEMMADLRMVKTKEEIELLKKAAELGDTGSKTFVNACVEGKSEIEVNTEAISAMERESAKRFPDLGISFWGYCQSGVPRTLMVHAPPTGKKVKKGEVVTWNVFPVIWSYWAEEEGTLIIGEPTPKQRKIFEVVLEAKEKATEAIAPGIKCSEIDRIASEVIKKAGFGESYIIHGTGHSFDPCIYPERAKDKAELRPNNDAALHEGCVICVEPGIYHPKFGGFRHSDMILVTKTGYEMLTKYEKGLVTV